MPPNPGAPGGRYVLSIRVWVVGTYIAPPPGRQLLRPHDPGRCPGLLRCARSAGFAAGTWGGHSIYNDGMQSGRPVRALHDSPGFQPRVTAGKNNWHPVRVLQLTAPRTCGYPLGVKPRSLHCSAPSGRQLGEASSFPGLNPRAMLPRPFRAAFCTTDVGGFQKISRGNRLTTTPPAGAGLQPPPTRGGEPHQILYPLSFHFPTSHGESPALA